MSTIVQPQQQPVQLQVPVQQPVQPPQVLTRHQALPQPQAATQNRPQSPSHTYPPMLCQCGKVPNSTGWSGLIEEFQKYDVELVNRWNNEVDTHLVSVSCSTVIPGPIY